MTDQTPHNELPPEHGQQQHPDGTAPNVPTNNTPGGPTHPRTPASPKKGLPGWAIGLIIAGGVLIIAIVAGATMVFALFANATKAEDCSAPGSCGQGLPPTPSEEPSGDPEGSGIPSDSVPLSGNANFANPPIWGAPYLSGWDATVLDHEGVNRFENRTLGCTFSTSQNMQDIVSTSSNDAATTQDLMDTLRDQLTKNAPNAVTTSEGSVNLSLGSAGSSTTIEFATLRLDYSVPEGDFASILYARSMPQSGSYMYTHLECTRTVFDSADSPLQELTDGLSVILVP